MYTRPQAIILAVTFCFCIVSGVSGLGRRQDHGVKTKRGNMNSSDDGISWCPTQMVKGELPWHVLVTTETNNCTGTIVDSQWVLVPGYCLTNDFDGRIQVYAGGANVNEWTQEKTAAVVQDKTGGFHRDVLLLKLDSPLTLDAYVSPIRLPKRTVKIEHSATVAGFGDNDNNNPVLSSTRLMVDYTGDNSRCPSNFSHPERSDSPISPWAEVSFCAFSSCKMGIGERFCQGDFQDFLEYTDFNYRTVRPTYLIGVFAGDLEVDCDAEMESLRYTILTRDHVKWIQWIIGHDNVDDWIDDL